MVLRLSDVGLVGERGSKVPNASIGELSLEIEVALALDFEYARCVLPRSMSVISALINTVDSVESHSLFQTVA